MASIFFLTFLMATCEVDLSTTSDAEEEPEQKTPKKKKKRKGPASKFLDLDAGEERKKKPKPRTPGKKSPVKTKAAERKLMIAAREEIPRLLFLLHPSTDTERHYEFPDKEPRIKFAQALKWAYQSEEEDGNNGYSHARSEFWTWWSTPMDSPFNVIWKANAELVVNTRKNKEDWRDTWYEEFEAACPAQAALYYVRNWVAHLASQRNIALNPDDTDRNMSKIVKKYLTDTFIVMDPEGSSIVWDPETKLWIARKKDRSAIALGEQMCQLMEKGKIIFTDEKLEEKFRRKISGGNVHNILSWFKGDTAVFPPPIKDKIDRAPWALALLSGDLMDLATLAVRQREPKDLFTVEANFNWFVDKVEGDTYIMDSKKLTRLKDLVCEGGARILEQNQDELYALLQQLCPNAFRFTQGPFRDAERHWPMLLHFGLFLTTHCIRKAIWVFGDGRGMKSTLISAIVNCIGKFAIPLAKKVLFAAGSESGHNTDLMRAEGKRFIFIDELEKKDSLRETIYKLLVSHQAISAREIYGGQGEWKPMGTTLIATNTVPPMEFSDCAIPDRIMAVKGTTRVFSRLDPPAGLPPHWEGVDTWQDGYDPEGNLFWVLKRPEEVKWAESFMVAEDEGGHRNELGCLLALAGHIAQRIICDTESGEIPKSPLLEDDQLAFFREADHVGQFLAECTQPDEKNPSMFKSVYIDYKQWCSEQGIKPVEQKGLTASLQQKGLMTRYKKQGPNSYYVKAVKVLLVTNIINK